MAFRRQRYDSLNVSRPLESKLIGSVAAWRSSERERVNSTMGIEEKHLRPDERSVLMAAALLDITEYDLFHLAYRRWHGQSANDKLIEPFFVAYMFDRIVPLWVRHFSRLVEQLSDRGELDANQLGVKFLPRSQHMVTQGMRYSVAIGLLLTSLVIFAEFMAQFLKLGERCMFPPCY